MIKEQIQTLENLIDKEIDGYKNIEKLYTDKREILISGKSTNLYDVDAKISDSYKMLHNAFETRQKLTKAMDIPTSSMTDIINKIKEQDKAAAEKLESKKQEVNELAQRLCKLENTNMELLKHGMHVTNKTLEIIIRGLKPITNEYNQRGQNITKDQLEMSSIVEEG